MKYTAIFALLLIVSAMGDQTEMSSKIQNLLSSQAKVADAVDSALEVLRDLRQVNIDAQNRADALNESQEASCKTMTAQLTQIADQNKEIGNDATTRRKWLSQEINDTHEYLVWIQQRRAEILARQTELEAQRCTNSQIFVRALKENEEALSLIALIKEDLLPFTENAQVDFAQIGDLNEKITAYSHLFNEEALKEFQGLTTLAEVDEEGPADWDSRADDNGRDALKLEVADFGPENRALRDGLGDSLETVLDRFALILQENIKKLEDSEIEGSWTLANWLSDSEKELDYLQREQDKKDAYIDKLTIQITAAKAKEDKVWEIYFQSAVALNDLIDDCTDIRQNYANAKGRREDENALLDEVIKTFVNQVSTVDNKIRSKMSL